MIAYCLRGLLVTEVIPHKRLKGDLFIEASESIDLFVLITDIRLFEMVYFGVVIEFLCCFKFSDHFVSKRPASGHVIILIRTVTLLHESCTMWPYAYRHTLYIFCDLACLFLPFTH